MPVKEINFNDNAGLKPEILRLFKQCSHENLLKF